MADDESHFLNELTIWKLKVVADEYNVDVSQCRYKRDYVQRIASKKITEEQVRAALERLNKARPEREREEESLEEVREIGMEVEEIAKKPGRPSELPQEEEKSMERHLDEALAMRPTLFDVDSAAESAYNKMIVGDYYEAIRENRRARTKCLEDFSSFQVYSAAVSIRAAEELLTNLAGQAGDAEADLRTALVAAKKAFIGGPPRSREEVLENVETLAAEVYEKSAGKAERSENELRNLLVDYESFGTRTEEPRRYLEIASQAKQQFNIGEYAKLVRDGRNSAERAKEVRAAEISLAFPMVRAATMAAKEVGVDTSKAELDFVEARRAFDEGALKRAVDLLVAVERATDAAHLEQIRRQKQLETSQIEKINKLLSAYEPTLAEATSYGLKVQEGTLCLSNAKAALKKKDVVNAAKFTHRLADIVSGTEKDLDRKRIELGVIKHIDGATCGKCGQESLYQYPSSMQKCMECGHSFSVGTESVSHANTSSMGAPMITAVETTESDSKQQGAQEKKEGERRRRRLLRW